MRSCPSYLSLQDGADIDILGQGDLDVADDDTTCEIVERLHGPRPFNALLKSQILRHCVSRSADHRVVEGADLVAMIEKRC